METNQKRAANGSVTQQQFAALEAKIIGLSQSVRDLQQTLSNMQRDIVTHNDVVLMEEMMRLLVANHLLDDIDKEIEATGKEMRIPTIPLGYELAFKGYNEIYFQPSSIEIWNLDSGLSDRPYITVQVWERKGELMADLFSILMERRFVLYIILRSSRSKVGSRGNIMSTKISFIGTMARHQKRSQFMKY